MKTPWSHNAIEGSVIGVLATQPKEINFIGESSGGLIVSVCVIDSCRRKWRVKARAANAGMLLNYKIGQKIKLTGIKGDLCKGAWDNAKRQIVPESIQLLDSK